MTSKIFMRNLIPEPLIEQWHVFQGTIAATWFGNPAEELKIVGVTGTNGKTSVCHYLTQILEESGKKVGMVTTVAVSINGVRELNKTKMTSLPVWTLQRYLSQMVK